MKGLLFLILSGVAAFAQPATTCNVSNAQTNGYVLTATSTGGKNCAWQPGAGVVIPGSNTQVLFNDSSALGANSGFTFNKSTGLAGIGTRVLGQTGDTLADIATPSNPSSGHTKTYSKSGKLCSLDSSGSENCTGSSGGTLAYGSSGSAISGAKIVTFTFTTSGSLAAVTLTGSAQFTSLPECSVTNTTDINAIAPIYCKSTSTDCPTASTTTVLQFSTYQRTQDYTGSVICVGN